MEHAYSGPGFAGRNRSSSKGGPSGVQRSSAAQLREHEPLFSTYEHLQGLSRGDAALLMLRKVASMVKPIMRKHAWRVQVLAEFLPPEHDLLGLNINKGEKICIRLRYHNNPDLFMSPEEVVDTMLHELTHNVWSDHDANFHAMWDQLRNEYEALVRKGYSGEGFLSEGKRLGSGRGGQRMPPPHEMRRLARANAEKRKNHSTLNRGSGQKLGGMPLHLQGRDIRQTIADQAIRRNMTNKACGSGRKDAGKLSQDSSNNTFKTKADEDDANNRAIAQALYDLMEEEEQHRLDGTHQAYSNQRPGLAWSPEHGLYDAGMTLPSSHDHSTHPTEEEQIRWAMRQSLDEAETSLPKPLLPPTTSTALGRTTSAPAVPFGSKPNQTVRNIRVQHGKLGGASSSKSSLSSIEKQAMIEQHSTRTEPSPFVDLTSDSEAHSAPPGDGDQWACKICTCINPLQYLACDACGVERPLHEGVQIKQRQQSIPTNHPRPRPQSTATARKLASPQTSQHANNRSLGWDCHACGAFMQHQWWTCSVCGTMKASS